MLGRSGLSWVQESVGRVWGDGAFLRVLSGVHNGDTGGGLAVMEDTEVDRRMGDSSYNATDFLVLQPAAKPATVCSLELGGHSRHRSSTDAQTRKLVLNFEETINKNQNHCPQMHH